MYFPKRILADFFLFGKKTLCFDMFLFYFLRNIYCKYLYFIFLLNTSEAFIPISNPNYFPLQKIFFSLPRCTRKYSSCTLLAISFAPFVFILPFCFLFLFFPLSFSFPSFLLQSFLISSQKTLSYVHITPWGGSREYACVTVILNYYKGKISEATLLADYPPPPPPPQVQKILGFNGGIKNL
jgi:hypothetical protein